LPTDHEEGSEDHANAVERLAQTAFSHATRSDRKRLVCNAFFRSIRPGFARLLAGRQSQQFGRNIGNGKAYFQLEKL